MEGDNGITIHIPDDDAEAANMSSRGREHDFFLQTPCILIVIYFFIRWKYPYSLIRALLVFLWIFIFLINYFIFLFYLYIFLFLFNYYYFFFLELFDMKAGGQIAILFWFIKKNILNLFQISIKI